MADRSRIGWTDATWPVVAGCDKVSPGCKRCYAIRDARRLSGNPNPKISSVYAGTVERTAGGLNWTGLVRPLPQRLDWPLRWRKPRLIFVCNESDLFHEDVPDEFIAAVFGVIAAAPQHTFQVLTKRPARMRDWFFRWLPAFTDRQRGIACAPNTPRALVDAAYTVGGETPERKRQLDPTWRALWDGAWPLPNVRIGASVENQEYADLRIPIVCELGEAGWRTMLSLEPLLGPVRLPDRYLALGQRAWCVAGGESGPGARECHLDWLRSLRDQCADAGVAYFCKQLGSNAWRTPAGSGGDDGVTQRVRTLHRTGADPAEWPEDLRIQQFPA